MPEIEIESREIGNRVQPVLWESRATIPADEINPDVLQAVTGMLIGTLEGEVEASNGAADWSTFMLHMTPSVRFGTDDPRLTLLSVSVRAL